MTYVYVDEQFKHRNIQQQDDLEAADELIGRVREADTFICVLAGSSHGSPIQVGGIPSSATFFEIELFQAALLQKKVHAFVRNDFAPEPQLQALLNILKDAFPEWKHLRGQTNGEILSDVKRIVDGTLAYRAIKLPLALPAPISRLVQALYAARARNRPNPSIHFVHDAADPSRNKPRVEIIQPLIQNIEHQPNEERRLSRIWIGLRELMALEYRVLRDQELLG